MQCLKVNIGRRGLIRSLAVFMGVTAMRWCGTSPYCGDETQQRRNIFGKDFCPQSGPQPVARLYAGLPLYVEVGRGISLVLPTHMPIQTWLGWRICGVGIQNGEEREEPDATSCYWEDFKALQKTEFIQTHIYFLLFLCLFSNREEVAAGDVIGIFCPGI